MNQWKIAFAIAFILPVSVIYGTSILFPEFNVYTELGDDNSMKSSYLIDMVVDTGIKYGVELGFGIKGYNLTEINSNVLRLDSIRLYSEPLDLFHLGFFIGKNTILGKSDFGYQGFQYHQRDNFEYLGYKEINGTGLEIYRAFWDDIFEPHLYFYSSDSLYSTNNVINLDTVIKFILEKYEIEGYFGINRDTDGTFYKHFGLTFMTKYSKVDFMLSLFSPDTPMNEYMTADMIYLNITEHMVSGIFEQNLTVFARPNFYNEFQETISNDIDIHLSLGFLFDSLGTGVETTLRYASNYDLSGKFGGYVYFIMNNLKYKIGGYYSTALLDQGKGNAFGSSWGAFMNISGSM